MHDRQYSAEELAMLFLLFVLVFAFGIVVGCVVCSSGGTGELTLTVVDADTGQPIGGASVTVDGQSTDTNPQGKATFGGLDTGDYTVDVSANGYESKSVTATVEQGSNSKTVQLEQEDESPPKPNEQTS